MQDVALRSRQLRAALEFVRAVAMDRSTRVVPVPGGVAVLNADFPGAHDHNRLLITEECTAEAMTEAADTVLGGAGLRHRLIDVHDVALGHRLTDGVASRGYEVSAELLMVAPPSVPSQRPSPVIEELALDERADVAAAQWRRDQPDRDVGLAEQLGRRIATITPVVAATFLAIRDGDGRVVARADLYLRDGIAQIEEVMTDTEQRNRGLASALVREAVRRARRAGADPVFLIADADDWPQQLYRRLGFTDLGRTLCFRATR